MSEIQLIIKRRFSLADVWFHIAECRVLEINFFARNKYLLPGIKASSNTYIPGSKVRGPKAVILPANPIIVLFLTKQNFIWSKALIMPLPYKIVFSLTNRSSILMKTC